MKQIASKVAAILLLGFSYLPLTILASPPDELPGGGGMGLKIPVGLERWLPGPVPNAETIMTGGVGWFRQNNLSLETINVLYPAMGYRAFDVEVESWGEDPRFSAVFVQNTGNFEAMHWFVTIGTEEEIRYQLFEGQWQNYRMMDLEVRQYHNSPPDLGIDAPEEVTQFEPEICALLVTNEGNQFTPEWDFVVYATPIELMLMEDSFTGAVRPIDIEISLQGTIESSNEGENLQNVVYSQIMVSNEGFEQIDTAIFQFDSILSLQALERDGWQLIDSERNIPLMPNHFPKVFSTFTGVFVRKNNLVEMLPNEDSYSNFAMWSTDDKRMIDLELTPHNNKSGFLLDELFLLY